MKKLSIPVKLALLFVLFGVSWILITDFFTFNSFFDPKQIERLEYIKGIIFIFLAAAFIFFVSRRFIKDLEKAREEQREALRRYNVLGMATNDAVCDVNFKTGECYTNRTLQEMFGYTAHELTDNNTWWTRNLHPDDRDRVISRLDSKLKGGSTIWQDEYRFRCKDGSYKVVFDRGFILRDKDEVPERLIGAMQDVSEQRALQNQLIEEKVKHSKEMAQNVINAHEAERKKLAEELHDNINQLLGVVKLYIEYALGDPPGKNDILKKSAEYLVQVIEEIRGLSKSLTPSSLTDIGLVECLREITGSIGETKKIAVELDTNQFDEGSISPENQLMIYRIIQEQLNNVIRHSKAYEVKIQLQNIDSIVHLEVADNGEGFDTVLTKPGMGLNNIRNRVQLMNGSMDIHSRQGEGTTLKIDFPVKGNR